MESRRLIWIVRLHLQPLSGKSIGNGSNCGSHRGIFATPQLGEIWINKDQLWQYWLQKITANYQKGQLQLLSMVL